MEWIKEIKRKGMGGGGRRENLWERREEEGREELRKATIEGRGEYKKSEMREKV
jgi:hypothetical protein